ncbi:TIGR03503 family protein [Motilimonas sp. E26]|uniref:TIGR03503 family protein n=1 Tax=Motilimonas sp. E26 TaxID=2865674 RepID=UPI001E386C96|nr:TIGR03503 family protein [Motilimonas sp. E26]MCE0556684.1 TIGR03503 family protein [Motilimonas sp. E26]
MARLIGFGCLLLVLMSAMPNQTWAVKFYEKNDNSLLDNRFRIDPKAEKVTFVIKRMPGAAATILVQPDGSKLYSSRHGDNVKWHEGIEFDMITIIKPMPGPWQAIGKLSPDNAIRIVSDLQLHMDKLPSTLYSHEQVKLTTALLNNSGAPVNEDYIQDLIITMTLTSLNDEADDNFAYGHKIRFQFLDDGKGYDEYPRDGILTAHPSINAPAGKYRVEVSTRNEVFTRAFRQDLLVYPRPIELTTTESFDQPGPMLHYKIDLDEILPETVVVKGFYEGVLDKPLEFIGYGKAGEEVLTITLPRPEEPGKYTVSTTAYATTRTGRELVLVLDDGIFRVVPEPVTPEPTPEVVIVEVEPEPEKSALPFYLMIAGGVLLLLAAVIVFIIWWKRRSIKRIAQKLAEESAVTAAPTQIKDGVEELNLEEESKK